MGKTIKEYKYTCSACGNIWYYGVQDESKQKIVQGLEQMKQGFHKIDDGTSRAMCCGCNLFAPRYRQDKNVNQIDFDKCPKCNSKAIKKELVTHNVE